MMGLAANPNMVRNVAIVGHLHHGKTSLVDMLVYETHKMNFDCDKPVSISYAIVRPPLTSSGPQLRYTDTHSLSQSRLISLKSTPMSLVLPTTRGKSYLINLVDTPGHINFIDEVVAGVRVADGAVVVVDAVEGVLLTTTTIIQHLVASGIPIV
jgi:U5 small nuclear ribonucleoprotein component